jgi:hypothetical protein
MNSRQRASQGSNLKSKRYVKNKLQIGDSRPTMGIKPENRAVGSQYASYNKVNKSNQGISNFYADQSNKSVKLADGTKFKKEVRARSPRASQVYGNKSKAMKASYEKTVKDPTKTKGTNTKKTASESGGLTSKKRSSRPRNKGLS